MHNRLQHDAAFVYSRWPMWLIGHLLREEKRKDAFGEIYRLTRTAIEQHGEAAERRRKRLRQEAERGLLRMNSSPEIQVFLDRLEQTIVDRLDRIETALTLSTAEYVSVKLASFLTSLSPSPIRRAIKSGDLAASNCGTPSHPLWRIARNDLIAWMVTKKGGTPKVPPKSEIEELIQRHLPGLRSRKDSATR